MNNESELIQFIGKDNIVFHCINFPIILKELGGYNLPTNVPANEFLNLEGQKLSTSNKSFLFGTTPSQYLFVNTTTLFIKFPKIATSSLLFLA